MKNHRAVVGTNPSFPFKTIWFSTKQRNFLEPHWHDEIEIIYIIKGKCILRIDGEKFVVKDNEAIVASSGQVHGGRLLEDGEITYMVIIFHPDFIKNAYDLGESIIEKEMTHLPSECVPLLIEIDKAYREKKSDYILLIQGLLMQVTALIRRNNQLNEKENSVNYLYIERLNSLNKYIEENYGEKISLDDASKIFHLSKKHFCRVFKKLTGMTFVSYLTSYRIRIAKKLLKEKKYSITQISNMVGFCNINYFDRQFKSINGYSPRHQK